MSDEIIDGIPWCQQFLEEIQTLQKSYAISWLKTAVKIDPDEKFQQKYTKIFSNEVKNLYEELVTDMNALKEKYVERIVKASDRIDYIKATLDVTSSEEKEIDFLSLKSYDLKLKLELEKYEKLWNQRQEEINRIDEKRAQLSGKLGIRIKRLTTTHTRKSLLNFEKEIQSLESEVAKREAKLNAMKVTIEEVAAETGLPIKEDIFNLITTKCEKLTDENMAELESYQAEIITAKDKMTEEAENLCENLTELWNILQISYSEKEVEALNLQQYCAKLKSEIEKAKNDIKEKLPELIEEQRKKINRLWDECCCKPATKMSFPAINLQEYNMELFEIFQNEIKHWETYYQDNWEIFETWKKYNKLKDSLREHELNIDFKALYKNRGGILLQESTKRSILTSRLKSAEHKLLILDQEYYRKENRKFLFYGEPVEKYINKEKQEHQSPFLHTQISPPTRGKQHKNKFKTPSSVGTVSSKHSKKSSSKKKTAPTLPKFKLNQNKTQSFISPPNGKRWEPSKVMNKMCKKNDDESSSSWATTTDYSDFERDIKPNKRSTSFSKSKLDKLDYN